MKKKYRIKRTTPELVYVGSLLQQRHSEEPHKGILKWDVPKRKWDFIHIPNDYSYITLNVKDGEMPDLSHVTKKARVRIKHENTTGSRLIEIIAEIRKKYPEVEEITDVKINSIISGEMSGVNKIDVGDVRDINFQNEMIREFLIRRHSIDDETMNKIYELNKEIHLKIPPREIARNVIWKPDKFTFSNMFSYGANNKLDFSQLKGIIGLFSGNTNGKSNLVEAMCFTIFDKSPRAWKAVNAMNNKKNTFHSKFTFHIDEKEYTIKRDARRKKENDVSVVTNFSFERGKEITSLNGEQRKETNKNIRSRIGEYDDFALTALMPQVNNDKRNTNFISMRQGDRKELLSRFLDLMIFQYQYDIANDNMREVTTRLKDFEKREFSKEIADVSINLKKDKLEYKDKKNKRSEYDTIYKKINKEIKNQTSKLIKIDMTETDLDKLKDREKTHKNNIIMLKSGINESKNKIKELIKESKDKESILSGIDSNIEEKYNFIIEIKKHKSDIKNDYDKYKIKIESKKNQLGELNQLVFSEDTCISCQKNSKFVRSKLDNGDELNEEEKVLNTLESKLINFNKMLTKSNGIENEYNKYIDARDEINNLRNQITQYENKKMKMENRLDKEIRSLDDMNKSIQIYHQNESNIKHNDKVNKIINDWEEKLEIVEDAIKKIDREILDLYSKIEINKQKKIRIDEEIGYVKELEIKSNAYRYYMEAVERDGVPFSLISKTIPVIETEINNILSQMVEFRILFHIDQDKKDIFPMIVYGEDNIWPLELTSGMERFISSVAIRVALISVSSLPRPNFLIVDEGFGSLDAENANSLYMLFDYLKTQFDFVLIISHLDYIKDMADSHIEIKKENGFSKILN